MKQGSPSAIGSPAIGLGNGAGVSVMRVLDSSRALITP
jgi:hypothetical protein